MTSLDFFKEKLEKHFVIRGNRDFFDKIWEQSKEMEEQEKIDFADKYGTYLLEGGIMSAVAYNETFKSE